MTLRVMTWLWKQPNGRTDYGAPHVNLWAAMVRRHCSLDIELACITDMPEGIDADIRIIAPPGDLVGFETPTWRREKPNCYRRIALFRPDAADLFGDRFVSMDLDCVIGDSLDPLWNRPEDFVMYRSPSASHIRRPYNGSMLMMTAGSRSQVFTEFDHAAAADASARYKGSDQAWISHVLGRDEAVWTRDDGVIWWGEARNAPDKRLMFFPGAPKPWEIAAIDPWIAAHYRDDVKEAA